MTLTYAIGLLGLFQWGVRQTAECENQMTSVERIMEYSALPPGTQRLYCRSIGDMDQQVIRTSG